MGTHANMDAASTDLISGDRVGLRRWENEAPGDWKPDSTRPYETVGVVLAGKAQLRVNGDVRDLATGDAYHVPAGATHSYRIQETFTAIEATSPPATA